MIELRPYQVDMIDRVRAELAHNQSVLLQSATGSGKTALAVHMMATAAQRGKRACFIVHQNELLSQTSGALWRQKLEHGMIASGKRRSPLSVQVASVQTLINRVDQYAPFDLLIIDEAHRAAAATYKKVIAAYPNAKVVGLTATPQRTDGKGLGDIFQSLVCGPTIREFIDAGYLCDYDLFAPTIEIDTSKIHTVGGDYNKAELQAVVDKPSITGDAVQHYASLAAGRRCVVMCVTVDHAVHVAEQYRGAGISAGVIHGGQTDKERNNLIDGLRDGRYHVLTNCQLLVEGVDVPSIEVVQWLRPTKSLIIWKQGNGRGFRPKPNGGKLLILDHVGNWSRHGLPDDDPEWTLEGKPKGKRKQEEEPDIGIQTCGQCRKVFCSGVRVCPHCGAQVELKERKIEIKDGILEKIERDFVAKAKRQEQGAARSIDDLVGIGLRRGMKHPAGWAANVFAARQGRKPTRDEMKRASDVAKLMRGAV